MTELYALLGHLSLKPSKQLLDFAKSGHKFYKNVELGPLPTKVSDKLAKKFVLLFFIFILVYINVIMIIRIISWWSLLMVGQILTFAGPLQYPHWITLSSSWLLWQCLLLWQRLFSPIWMSESAATIKILQNRSNLELWLKSQHRAARLPNLLQL